MTTTISFKIRTIKHQIQACLRAIGNGLRSFVDRLCVLEAELETITTQREKIMVQQPQPMKVQIKTGSEHHTTNWRSAMVRINGQPIYEVLKPLSKPEWEMVGNRGNHGKWCIAEYELPVGANVEFTAKANSQKPIEFSFKVGEVTSVDVEGFNYSSAICGWIVSI
ncbi:MAG: hypothetical protein RLZZ184_3237 [Cyanobacteriota bacterium]